MNDPSAEDKRTAEHILSYLSGTPHKGLHFAYSANPDLLCYADASWACHRDMKSHSGIVVLLMGAPVFTGSTKQRIVTRSSTDAEIIACDAATDVALWVANVCEDIGYDPGGITILQDNTTAILTVSSNVKSGRYRTIPIRLEHVKELVREGKVNIKFVPTDLMIADGLTKPLHGGSFKKFVEWTTK
jgi:hypothetical protein